LYTAQWNDHSKDLKAHFKTLNTTLSTSKYLVGNELTLADIIVACTLIEPLQTVLDGGFRKAMKSVTDWLQAIFDSAAFSKTFGKVQMCAKPMKPVCLPDPKVEQPKKAEAAPKPAPKKEEEKPKSNTDLLPPTSFDLYSFKTFYVNHPDKKGVAVDQFYKDLDWNGWAFWHLHYDKIEGECEKVYLTKNMLGGFLSRAEHVNKICFGKMGIIGNEPKLEIEGVWLMRGTELPDGLVKEHS